MLCHVGPPTIHDRPRPALVDADRNSKVETSINESIAESVVTVSERVRASSDGLSVLIARAGF